MLLLRTLGSNSWSRILIYDLSGVGANLNLNHELVMAYQSSDNESMTNLKRTAGWQSP